jgi:hypothetical protein
MALGLGALEVRVLPAAERPDVLREELALAVRAGAGAAAEAVAAVFFESSLPMAFGGSGPGRRRPLPGGRRGLGLSVRLRVSLRPASSWVQPWLRCGLPCFLLP